MIISEHIKKEIKNGKPVFFKDAFEKIFSWKDLEALLNLRPFVNSKRLTIINNRSYTWNQEAWLSDVNTFPPSLLDRELKKHVCYLSDSSRVNEKVNSICQELEETFFNSCVDAHIYFTVAETMEGGFGIHWDFSHNLIVQMEGSTRFLAWDVYADSSVTERVAESLDEDPLIDVVMNPGDAIFIPLRSYHRALSQTKRMSISFPVSFGNEFAPQDRKWIKLNV
jgi:ribosomal protein L16 Arg81 hydroxylase